jgi:Family of unknown function (DUF5906)
VFNLYRPPTIVPGDPTKAGLWLDHVKKVFPDDANHIITWCAHRVQHPEVKTNHSLLLASEEQGIGKDTIMEPVKRAVGPWNFQEISPQQLMERFNGFLKSIILRINEARDLGDINRFQFYDHMKAITASPPDVLRIDEKNRREYNILNCVGVVITTNYKTTGLYLPAEDRRTYVAWSNCKQKDFDTDYWNKIYGWYDSGGDAHVAAYLAALDISAFDPKAPPPKTAAFWAIVDANRSTEDSELADVLDEMDNPKATTVALITDKANENRFYSSLYAWLGDRRNGRAIPHRMEKCGYVAVRNEAAKDAAWKIGKRRHTVYAKSSLSIKDQVAAVTALIANEVNKAKPNPNPTELQKMMMEDAT